MIGLDYVMAGYLHLAAGQITCELKKTPEITVVATDTTLKVDHSKSQAELNNFEIDTVSPYGANVQTHVGGLTSGEIRTSSNMRIMTEVYPTMNAACLMIDKIAVTINVKPTVYIAREYPANGCMYRAIMDHEKKHVQADRTIINKYTNIIIGALDAHFKKKGYKAGPVSKQSAEAVQKQLSDESNKIVESFAAQMSAERRQLQQKVDSLEEYNRVNALCKGRK